MRETNPRILALLVLANLGFVAAPAWSLDDDHWHRANRAIERGIEFLRGTQKADGSWSPGPGPAITAMVSAVMLERIDISAEDPQVAKAIAYILSKARDDGSICDGILANYNTAICLTALSHVNNRPDVAEVVARAQAFLRGLQWAGQTDPQGRTIDANHCWFGGAGYGKHGRPDLSNTQIMLQGLFDSGVTCDDPAFQRALVFISRCQGTAQNDQFADVIEPDGGFVYATSVDKDHIGVPESKASPDQVDEAKLGRPVSGLRGYGSMTYAGFKSYVYAHLARDDPRVVAAHDWIRRHYQFDRNPGMPEKMREQGLYYMYMTMGRALNAWGATYIQTPDGRNHDWANDLIDAVVQRQRPDGSWVNPADRWMEGDANLVTAYALIALQSAVD